MSTTAQYNSRIIAITLAVALLQCELVRGAIEGCECVSLGKGDLEELLERDFLFAEHGDGPEGLGVALELGEVGGGFHVAERAGILARARA